MEIRWMKRKNKNGNDEKFYPITHVDAIVGLSDIDFGDLENPTDLVDTEPANTIAVDAPDIPVVVQNEIDNVKNNLQNKIDDVKNNLQNEVDNSKSEINDATTALENRLVQMLENEFNQMCNIIYPVGSIYISVNSASPATLFGGTWEQIQDRFLLSAGNTYGAGTTGGAATHTLTEDEMPSHGHVQTKEMPNEGIANVVRQYASGGYSGDTYGAQTTWLTSKAPLYTNYTGGSKAHNNMPPYLVVYIWKRIS